MGADPGLISGLWRNSFVDPAPPTAGDGALNVQTGPVGSTLRAVRIAMAGLWTFVILLLCWIPGNMVRKFEGDSSWFFHVPDLDKIVHASIFIVFSLLWARAWPLRRPFRWIALAGFGLAILTEVVQKLAIIGRDGSVGDTVVDFAGVLVGLVAVPLVDPLAKIVESRLFGNKPDATQALHESPTSVEPLTRRSV
jgi:hypothetical protein